MNINRIGKIGSFSFAETNWNLVIDSPRCQRAEKIFEMSIPDLTIYFDGQYQGERLNNDAIESAIYKAIVSTILNMVGDGKWANPKLTHPLAAFIMGFHKTYPNHQKVVNGKFMLGGTTWTVTVDNDFCTEEAVFGLCSYYSQMIYIMAKDGNKPIHPTVMYTTLVHEVIHACMGVLGKWGHTYLNEERFVCTFSTFVSQALRTLKVKLPVK